MMRSENTRAVLAFFLGLAASAGSHAQVAGATAETSMHSHAVAHADEIFSAVLIDQLEVRDGENGQPLVLDGQAWLGSDLNKFWLKADTEAIDDHAEELELQALFSRAVAPFWDVQLGLRADLRPRSGHNWAVIGIQGLAPYFFETDAALFIGDSGRTAVRLAAEYELLLSQRWVMSPEVEINLYGRSDRSTLTGSGLSDAQAGVRLRYEITREFAPYIGVDWSRKFGGSADFAKDAGFPVHDTQWLAGVRIWF